MTRFLALGWVAFTVLVVVMGGGVGQAAATSINNTFGLPSPAQTIAFDEFVFSSGTPITNQYSSLGVTFTTGIKYDFQVTTFPNIIGHRVGNFQPISNPFSINFESFSAPTNTTSSQNYFGFTRLI